LIASRREGDLWRAPALALWLLVFLVGLAPEPVFLALRLLAHVTTQDALVNSPFLITIALAAYVGLFALKRCTEVGIPAPQAQDKALQVGIMGLVAFLPFHFPSLVDAYVNPLVPNPAVVYGTGAAKMVVWCYLLSLFIRYYAFGSDAAFAKVQAIFPSSRRARQEPTRPTEPDHKNNEERAARVGPTREQDAGKAACE